MKQQNTEHRRNSGTPWSNGGTTERAGASVEHPEISTEQQLNTSRTPLNNRTIQDKEQL